MQTVTRHCAGKPLHRVLRSLTLFFAPVLVLASAPVAARPNVLLILTDDQGYSDVGYNGNPWLKTPRLDALAAQGLVFSHFYTQPMCSPTRAALMTGRNPIRLGVIDTQSGVSILPPAEVTLAEVLAENGYRTGLFGKWHLGDNAPARPQDQGFQRVLTFTGGMIGASYSPPGGRSYFDPILIDDGIDRKMPGYAPDIFTDAAMAFAKRSVDEKRPFFAFLSLNTPHHPLTVSDAYADPYRKMGLSEETSRYYGMISNIDWNVGRMLDLLNGIGALDNTIVVFLSDNGTSSLHQQKDLWQIGLRGRKSFVYENGIRVPFIMKLTRTMAHKGVRETPVGVEDIMPTLLKLVGIDSDLTFDGMDMGPTIASKRAKPPPRDLFFQFHRGIDPVAFRNIAIRRGKLKLVQPVGRGNEAFGAGAGRYEVYDIDRDPAEQNDLASTHPKIVEAFKARYAKWFAATARRNPDLVETWIGSTTQNPVELTRQDWVDGGLEDGQNGHYRLNVQRGGTYRFTFRWSRLLTSTHAVSVQLGDKVFARQILQSEDEARIEDVRLQPGRIRLEASLMLDGTRNGFERIIIERTGD